MNPEHFSDTSSPVEFFEEATYEETPCDPELLAHMVEALRRPAKLRQSVVLIPVAAAQDSKLIYPALEQYAKSERCLPFSIALNLNQPTSLAEDFITPAQNEVARAVADFPHLDVRTIQRRYDTPTIGAIRADLWDATTTLAEEESDHKIDRYIGYNHDIDLVRLPSHYMRETQYSFYTALHTPVVASRVRHDRTGNLPNANKATALYDAINTEVAHLSYEAGLIIPFATYRERGGFRRTMATHETRVFSDYQHTILAAPPLYTSSRRLIERINSGATLATLWTDETFSAEDACRDPANIHDLSPAATTDFCTDIIQHSLPDAIARGALYASIKEIATRYNYSAQDLPSELWNTLIEKHTMRKKTLARRILQTVLGTPAHVAKRLTTDD